jgi:hypothetical protein
MNLSQLFAESEKVLNGECLLRVPESFDKGNGREADLLHVLQIDRSGRPPKIRHTAQNDLNQPGMLLRRWALLKLIKGHMNVLQPFMSLLNKEIDQLSLKIVYGIGTHEISLSH